MIRTFVHGTTLTIALIASSAVTAGEPSCPMHAQHMAEKKQQAAADGSAHHGKEVDQRHDTFGMSHDASTHSFRLFADGGAIELRANRNDDANAIAAIRTHLEQIVEQFNRADFSTPGFVHGYPPAGVAEMERLRGEIAYGYQSLPAGGRIRITTRTPQAIAAIHDFLRFQVTEHRTADSGKIEEDKQAARR
jgi:hypothetical protein